MKVTVFSVKLSFYSACKGCTLSRSTGHTSVLQRILFKNGFYKIWHDIFNIKFDICLIFMFNIYDLLLDYHFTMVMHIQRYTHTYIVTFVKANSKDGLSMALFPHMGHQIFPLETEGLWLTLSITKAISEPLSLAMTV